MTATAAVILCGSGLLALGLHASETEGTASASSPAHRDEVPGNRQAAMLKCPDVGRTVLGFLEPGQARTGELAAADAQAIAKYQKLAAPTANASTRTRPGSRSNC